MADEDSTAEIVDAQHKRCSGCTLVKHVSAFKAKFRKDGALSYSSLCKKCRNAESRKRYAEDPVYRAKQNAANVRCSAARRAAGWADPNFRARVSEARCPGCNTTKPAVEFYSNRSSKTGLSVYCILCTNRINNKNRKANNQRNREDLPHLWWAKSIFNTRRGTANAAGIPFSITIEDVHDLALKTSHCPILGVELDYANRRARRGGTDTSPSLDRFEPDLGYVPGNIEIVSHKANTMKSNGAAVDHAKVAAWYLRHPKVAGEDRRQMIQILQDAIAPPLLAEAAD